MRMQKITPRSARVQRHGANDVAIVQQTRSRLYLVAGAVPIGQVGFPSGDAAGTNRCLVPTAHGVRGSIGIRAKIALGILRGMDMFGIAAIVARVQHQIAIDIRMIHLVPFVTRILSSIDAKLGRPRRMFHALGMQHIGGIVTTGSLHLIQRHASGGRSVGLNVKGRNKGFAIVRMALSGFHGTAGQGRISIRAFCVVIVAHASPQGNVLQSGFGRRSFGHGVLIECGGVCV
mmetsp:Transcript_13714/g.37937  ORF Transcript_13714/g.37937 Transcript_13714/m.37937 type:complete len:232 (-) Transcript_13714:533-1228(-)